MQARLGSGTFVGINTLADALVAAGRAVEIVKPRAHLPVLTAERRIFNEWLRFAPAGPRQADVGFDFDGFRSAGRAGVPHIAAPKGVIADELRFEQGLTRRLMSLQARWERVNVARADVVIATSRYSAACLREYYGRDADAVIPEPIDLSVWEALLRGAEPRPAEGRFVVLCAARLYRRKRIGLLLQAAAMLRGRIPELEVRIVGDGPEWPPLRRLWRELRLERHVKWLGYIPVRELAREYSHCDVFCLPSVQEGFGIVFLEAMAAGAPVVAARAAAVPEVAACGLLVEPDNAEALGAALERLYGDSHQRRELAAEGRRIVKQYDAPAIARAFLLNWENRRIPTIPL